MKTATNIADTETQTVRVLSPAEPAKRHGIVHRRKEGCCAFFENFKEMDAPRKCADAAPGGCNPQNLLAPERRLLLAPDANSAR